ncbi:MAG: hypothetical protein ABI406_19165 [Ktedonobacteraceae bacterium]
MHQELEMNERMGESSSQADFMRREANWKEREGEVPIGEQVIVF